MINQEEEPVKTHPENVLTHLKQHGTITGKEAWSQYGCYRLSSVIHRLIKRGNDITMAIVENHKHAEYTLHQPA